MSKFKPSFPKINIVAKRPKLTPKSKKHRNSIIALKLFLILLLLGGMYYFTLPFSNSISLLAVSEDENGDKTGGSLVKLSLTTKPGSGNIYVNLNTLGETDTQISIINSQRIACNLFDIDCNRFDFFYEFSDSNAIVLKGPSASSAIAILVAKNLNKERIPDDVAITGSLNAGGLIGVVGGVDEKVKVAQNSDFNKVLIPIFATNNLTNENVSIEVVKVLDIIDAYNEFSTRDFILEKPVINNTNYVELMRALSEDMCERTESIRELINESDITNTSSTYPYLRGGIRSHNSSQNAYGINNYYSAGSFCFNANINFRTLQVLLADTTLEHREEKIEDLREIIIQKIIEIRSPEYKENIVTVNDFYVYLVLTDRLHESRQLIESLDDLEIIVNETTNYTITNLTRYKERKDTAFAYALERLNSVFLWEGFMSHSGEPIKLSNRKVNYACSQITKQIALKSELLETYEISFLDDEISEQLALDHTNEDNFLCIYRGFELDGRINTILSSSGIASAELANYSREIVDFAQTRVNLNSDGHFPLIPTIYSEYSKDLLTQEDYTSSLLYSNFALSYSELNMFLEEPQYDISFRNEFLEALFGKCFIYTWNAPYNSFYLKNSIYYFINA